MIGWKVSTSRLGVKGLLGTLMSLFAGMVVCGDQADTCGDYFYLPLFPSCELFLEAIPCFNHTSTIIVTITTPAGERIHGFKVNYGSMNELPIYNILKERNNNLDGLIVKSTYDISLYIHQVSGDSLIVYPLDTYTREYEIANMSSPTSYSVYNNKWHNGSGKTSSSFTNNNSNNISSMPEDSILYLFSPFNSTTITITTFTSLDTLPGVSSRRTIVTSDAFEIHRLLISSASRHILTSRDLFAVVLVQPKSGPLQENMTLCQEIPIMLFDFLPPGHMLGTQFYLAFPSQVAFTLYFHGKQNASVDILTETSNLEVYLGDSGSTRKYVTKTSSAWISSVTPVGIYITLSVCPNSSTPSSSSFISSAVSSSSSSSQKSPSSSSSSSDVSSLSSLSSSSNIICSESGFFLPSVEHFFTCTLNKSKDACLCTCPSVFQREVHKNHPDFNNKDNSSQSTYFPLLLGELYEISTTILPGIDFNRTYDVVMTTNSSFMVFRHDFDNLNLLPAGGSLVQIYNPCFSVVHNVFLNSCQDSGSTNNKNSNNKNIVNSNNENNEYDNKDIRDDINNFQNDDTDTDLSSSSASSSSSSSSLSSSSECTCDNIFDVSSSASLARRERYQESRRNMSSIKRDSKGGRVGKASTRHYRVGEYMWVEDDEDQTRPMIAVVVSLSVAIFAVVVLILGYMMDEWISQRRLVRNTKIRPFVS